jgi:hypothetical protein
MIAQRAIAKICRLISHPAFWLPLLLAIGVHLYTDGLRFNVKMILSDGWGYYLPLPAIFVYGDPLLTFLNRPDLASDLLQYRFPDGTWQGLSVRGAGYLDKYAFGPAVVQLPFFLVALLLGQFRYAMVNGFEPAFQIANSISGAFYFGLGSFLIYRACRLRNDTLPSALALATTILASNILHYASGEASFAHVYGYCLLAGLVYLTVRRVEFNAPPSLPTFVLFGALIGLAVIVRPTNAVYSFLFVVFARGTPLRDLFIGGACAFLASAVAASPQMAWWYVTSGQPIYYSYTGEGFHFAAPEFRNYMFSIRKGVFFWHPLYLLMIVALLATLLRRPLEGAVSTLIVLMALYLGAAWSDYTFGHSFGSRQSIELLPVLIVPFTGAIASVLASGWRGAASGLVVFLIAVNIVQYRGYIKGTLLHNDNTRVTYARFWANTLGLPAIERYLPQAQ